MICAGIDAGSRSTKVVLLDADKGALLARGACDQGVEQESLASALLERTCAEAGIERHRISAIVATGYGRNLLGFADCTITEITCHARGVYHLLPATRTVIEIGGQDSKCLFLEDRGRVRDFAMNDRCAAGSGRFLELVASRLEVSLPELGDLGRESRAPALISSMCVVFAETEIIGLLAQGVSRADIAAGVQNAIAQRVVALTGRGAAPPIAFTGGVALLPGMTRALEQTLECSVTVAPLPQYTGALGAALLAGERFKENPARVQAARREGAVLNKGR
jgi:predicted CoA-substrate-specific enzyme activase